MDDGVVKLGTFLKHAHAGRFICSKPLGLQRLIKHDKFHTFGVGTPRRLQFLLKNCTVIGIKLAGADVLGRRQDPPWLNCDGPEFARMFPSFEALDRSVHATKRIAVFVLHSMVVAYRMVIVILKN